METIVGILMFVGGVISLVGSVGLVVAAFKEDIVWGLLVLLVPCASLVFIVKHWDVAKGPFLTSLAGILLQGLATCGGGMHALPFGRSGGGGGGDAATVELGEAPPAVTDVSKWMNMPSAVSRATSGGRVDFRRLRGSVVVVEYWATWCPPCLISVPKLDALQRQRAGDGLVILGLTRVDRRQSADQVEAFVREKISYPVGLFTGEANYERYEVEGIPYAAVVDREGKVAWTGNPLDPDFEATVVEKLAEAPPAGTQAVATTERGPTLEEAMGGPRPSAPAGPAVDLDDPQVLLERAAAVDPGVRNDAVGRWLRLRLHERDGARRAMFKALGGPRLDPEVDGMLLDAVQSHPLGGREALDCLPLAPPRTRAALVQRLIRPDRGVPAQEVAAALETLRDADEPWLEEQLLRLGHPRPGAVTRLLAARGVDWARTPEGKAILAHAPPAELAALFGSDRTELRLLGVALVVERGPDVALEHLLPAVTDLQPAVRQEAASALERLHDPRAALLLVRAVRSEQDEPTRVRLRRALAALPQGPTADVLLARLESPEPELRLDAVVGLELAPSPPGVSALAKALEDQDAGVRLAACKALGALKGSRAQGVSDALARAAPEPLRRAALESPDQELRRAARNVYFQLRGRLPEQEQGAAPTGARGGVASSQPAGQPEQARPQVEWRDGAWEGAADARYVFDADPKLLANLQVEPRFRATVEGINRRDGSTIQLCGLRVRLEVRGAQGWKAEEKPFDLAVDPHQRVVTALGGGKYRVEDVRRCLRMAEGWFDEEAKKAVAGAIRQVRIREQGRR